MRQSCILLIWSKTSNPLNFLNIWTVLRNHFSISQCIEFYGWKGLYKYIFRLVLNIHLYYVSQWSPVRRCTATKIHSPDLPALFIQTVVSYSQGSLSLVFHFISKYQTQILNIKTRGALNLSPIWSIWRLQCDGKDNQPITTTWCNA